MSPLEFWLTRETYGTQPIEEGIVFTSPLLGGKYPKVCVVENQEEEDTVFALQFMYGGECPIIRHDGRTMKEYLQEHGRVFTTWDPADRNRI